MILASVVKKATFECAGEILPLKSCPLYITDKSTFIPPKGIVKLLEKNRHDIVVEQTLDAAKFNLLFHYMSKYFTIQPKKTFQLSACQNRSWKHTEMLLQIKWRHNLFLVSPQKFQRCWGVICQRQNWLILSCTKPIYSIWKNNYRLTDFKGFCCIS